MQNNTVVITGIGLISSLGEGVEAHWQAFNDKVEPRVDSETFKPYTIHPLVEVDWNNQIPKRGDQRQMETWQRIGTYTAGLALQDAGIKDNEELCATMDMVVAAGGGERDVTVDKQILTEGRVRNDLGTMLNEKLTTELRPTLFLAQLSNLLAGNISIVHKVTGSSRTFMGEEGSGVSAIDTAVARIRSGQSTHALVGGAYNSEHPDMLLGYELNGLLKTDGWAPLWQRERGAGGGVVTGSGGAFLVLESLDHAKKRGARAYAAIDAVHGSQIRRTREDLTETIAKMVGAASADTAANLIISGACGFKGVTAAEKAALDKFPSSAVRGIAGKLGHLREAQFSLVVALAALNVFKGTAFPPIDADNEKDGPSQINTALATAIGGCRSEGVARLSRV
ncbi:beta-ketoacyl-ACP synthase II [Phyllobacterium brassicacearum]|uniref:Beta-ketoacyl-ACP synthase II n=1 Tax=Phyllobacterium brassicacearum TaxID=314235 RepID=A0A2P7BTP3_9HYPH|nr:beta-ketoacyl-ACP synthase [Phyllobacterium brassicacearum]PSH69791.1 beta-ketoacyl-ACP synthase II [Phyllobacterium brassicacearum]TDQ34947.1 3-oxoacyl-[acyl-carrier-protein] synthase II [Phyllobacterium brassicacearum]